jgi:hypothetical protein
MSEKLEDILDNANLDDLDSVLSRIEGGESEEDILATLESGDTGGDEKPAADPAPNQDEKPIVEAEPEPLAAQADDGDDEPVLLAKDGKNQIPFSVLENERAQSATMKAQLDELNRKNALLESQLTAADITPKDLPENVRFTPEQIADFESYGEIGEAVAILAQQNAALAEQLRSSNTQPQPEAVHQPDTNPLSTNEDTLRWAGNDAHWGVVESVNATLEADPSWSSKSLADRIPEIVRRTKAALGESSDETIDAAAAKALEGSTRKAPNSLTDVGGEVLGSTKPIIQQLEDGDIQDVEAYLSAQTAKGRSMDEVLTELLP